MERGVDIAMNSQLPLQIKTDSAIGSTDKIIVAKRDEGGGFSSISIQFYSKVVYEITSCSGGFKLLPIQPFPGPSERVWTVAKTPDTIIITCNGVELLRYRVGGSTDERCEGKWGKGVVMGDIQFSTADTASDFYQIGNDQDAGNNSLIYNSLIYPPKYLTI